MQAERIAVGRRFDVPGEANWYGYRPRGVVSVIAPWNFPLAIPAGMTVAALVTGNTVVLKPAEQSSVIAVQLVRILHDAGVPPEALQLVPGNGEELGPVLVGHPEVAMVAPIQTISRNSNASPSLVTRPACSMAAVLSRSNFARSLLSVSLNTGAPPNECSRRTPHRTLFRSYGARRQCGRWPHPPVGHEKIRRLLARRI